MSNVSATALLSPPQKSTAKLLDEVRRERRKRGVYDFLMLIGLAAVAVLVMVLWIQKGRQSTAIAQLTSSLGTTCTQANTGVLPAAVQVDCNRAQRGEVPEVVQGITGATGATGPNGADGKPGEGITGTMVDPQTGHLIVTYTNGEKADLGMVVGQNGATGLTGGAGVAGRGVSSVTIVDGRLVVSYSDGTTSDAGPAPVGPAGRDGANGANGTNGTDGRNGSPATSITITRSDGTTVTCPRDAGSPDDAPTYTCPAE